MASGTITLPLVRQCSNRNNTPCSQLCLWRLLQGNYLYSTRTSWRYSCTGKLARGKPDVNIRNTKIMNIKGNMTATLHGNFVQVTKSQKDLGIIVNNCLIWTDNSNKRCSKGMNALYQLKRNLSEKAHWTTKLTAYTGNVVPIVTYASQAWMPNRKNMEKHPEKSNKVDLVNECILQGKALFFAAPTLMVDFHLDDEDESVISTRQVERGEFLIKRSKHRKTDDEFFRRTKILYNFVPREYKGARPTNDSLTRLTWTFLRNTTHWQTNVHGESYADVDTATSWANSWQLNLHW